MAAFVDRKKKSTKLDFFSKYPFHRQKKRRRSSYIQQLEENYFLLEKIESSVTPTGKSSQKGRTVRRLRGIC
jgi:hypothetical protein